MATLYEYRVNLGWSYRKFGKEAGISGERVRAAEKGEAIFASTAKALADALSRALNREVKPLDIDGLNIM